VPRVLDGLFTLQRCHLGTKPRNFSVDMSVAVLIAVTVSYD
jgi:hypothetical protein